MVDHQVFLILQDFDGDLWSLSRGCHVWLVHSPVNDDAARGIWGRESDGHSPLHGATTFDSSGDRIDDLYLSLGLIDEHHAAWGAIHVRGVELEEVDPHRIATELEDVDFRTLPESGGFAILRAAHPGATADESPHTGDSG